MNNWLNVNQPNSLPRASEKRTEWAQLLLILYDTQKYWILGIITPFCSIDSKKKHTIIFILSLYDCLRDTIVWKTKENHQNKMSQYLTWRYETMICFGLSHLNTMIAITFISQDLIIYWINQKYNMIKTFHK